MREKFTWYGVGLVACSASPLPPSPATSFQASFSPALTGSPRSPSGRKNTLIRVRNANCIRLRSSAPSSLGGTSSMFSQNTLSLSCGSGSRVYSRRTACPLPGSMRNTGGNTVNGALAFSGVDLLSPSSSQTCTNTGLSPLLVSLTVTSLLLAGYTTRVPLMITLASLRPTSRLAPRSRPAMTWRMTLFMCHLECGRAPMQACTERAGGYRIAAGSLDQAALPSCS